MIVNKALSHSSFIDSHCHLDFDAFNVDRQTVISQAEHHGVSDIIIPGVCRSRWDAQMTLCDGNANIHFALGCHPYFLKQFADNDLSQLEHYARHSKCVAIGECGIDSTIEDVQLQSDIFIKQIDIANHLELPLIVHHRKSHHLIQAAFKVAMPRYGGVIHAFSGSIQDARKYIDWGFKLGIGGTVTYPRAQKTRDVVSLVSLSDLLLETDSPNMPLFGRQGERNEPRRVVDVANVIAKLKNVTPQHVAEITTKSVNKLFNLPNT